MAYRPALTDQIPQVPPGLIEAWAARRHSVTPRAAFRRSPFYGEVAVFEVGLESTGRPVRPLGRSHRGTHEEGEECLERREGPASKLADSHPTSSRWCVLYGKPPVPPQQATVSVWLALASGTTASTAASATKNPSTALRTFSS